MARVAVLLLLVVVVGVDCDGCCGALKLMCFLDIVVLMTGMAAVVLLGCYAVAFLDIVVCVLVLVAVVLLAPSKVVALLGCFAVAV